MTEKSLLAAVHAAVNDPAPKPGAAEAANQQETTTMAGQNEPAAAPATKPTTAAELSAAFPELAASLRAEGAQAERERITGLDKLGKDMPGHDALINSLKADGKTTPEQGAVQVIAAEGKIRDGQLAGIASVEDKTGKVAAAAVPQGEQQQSQQADTPEGWTAQFDAQTPAGAALRAEFGTKERYVIFKKNEGKIHILGARKRG